MISIKLGDKKYTVPTVTGRAMREIGRMDDLYHRAKAGETLPPSDMDVAVEWLCVLFQRQFTADDVYDKYPASQFWYDVWFIYLAVQNRATEKLADFPTRPEATETKAKSKRRFGTWFSRIMTRC